MCMCVYVCVSVYLGTSVNVYVQVGSNGGLSQGPGRGMWEHLGPGGLGARLNGEQGCGANLLRVVGALLGPQFPQASWGSAQWPCKVTVS